MFIQLYNPRDELLKRINNSKGFDGDNILALMNEVRELLSYRKTKNKYPVLNLYCNWCHHYELEDSKTIYNILEKITEILWKENEVGSLFTRQINKLLSMEELREQLLELFLSEKIPDYLFSIPENWHEFKKRLLSKIVKKPIQFPNKINIYSELSNNKYKSSSNKIKYAIRIINRLKAKAEDENFNKNLIVTKLFLDDRVDEKRTGDVYWFIEISQQRLIMGRLIYE